MKRLTMMMTAMLFAMLVVLSGATVSAQNTNVNERTFMTFSNSVELPELTLPAGTYVFRLADIPTRNVVQVLDKDEKEMLGQWTFVQSERPAVSEETVVMFKENREGATPAVQYWYFPGERIGKEFIYPKDQAAKIASRTGADVMTADGRVTSESTSTNAQASTVPESTQAAAPAPPSNPAPAIPAPAARVDERPVGTSGALDQAPTPRQESTQARVELPETASPVPLAGLLGLMSLAGALGARKLAAVRR